MTTPQIAYDPYDISYNPQYEKRKLFLDGTVTIQRFDTLTYPKLGVFEDLQRGFFWNPEEISLVKDKSDFQNSSRAIQHIFTSNILRQTTLDSEQGRTPAMVFGPVCSVPELEALCLAWGFFETNIHSKSYAHIIRNVYGIPKDEFDKIHQNEAIVQMSSNIGKYYNHLYRLNCIVGSGGTVSEDEHCEAIWMALHDSYALEAIRFMVSFATSLGMVENKIFIGNGAIIGLILQDEILHTEWTAYIINTLVATDPRFAKLAKDKRVKAKVKELYDDVIREEKAWADYLFMYGPVIGLNAQILKDFVDYNAYYRLANIGIKYNTKHIKTNIPWFNRHVRIDKKQTALQETESTEYLIARMNTDIDLTQLPDLVI